MSGCFGNDPYDRYLSNQLDKYLKETYEIPEKREEEIDSLAEDKYKALPDFYTSRDGIKRFTNFEDMLDGVDQKSLISIARFLRDEKFEDAGKLLGSVIMEQCRKQAEYEIDERDYE